MKYLCDPQIIPSVVPRDLTHIESYAAVVAGYTNWLHVDIDDGQFESETTWPFRQPLQLQELDTFQQAAHIPAGLSLDVHLMAFTQNELGEKFARAGFKRLTVHREAFDDDGSIRRSLSSYRDAGAQEVGLALKIDTPISSIEELVDACDFIHLMSIADIGLQGKAFDERALSRVEELHAMYPDLMVCVDGGVSEATVEELVRAGANRLIVGHVLAESSNPEKTYARIHERAMRGCSPAESGQEPANT
jgi:ribulose-phosphate 3-epimerase